MGLAIQEATKGKYQTGMASNNVAVGLRLSRERNILVLGCECRSASDALLIVCELASIHDDILSTLIPTPVATPLPQYVRSEVYVLYTRQTDRHRFR